MEKEIKQPISQTTDVANYTPFVNEECGDTMWDEVLKNMDEKIEKTALKGVDLSFRL